jgi:hypothetical protein
VSHQQAHIIERSPDERPSAFSHRSAFCELCYNTDWEQKNTTQIATAMGYSCALSAVAISARRLILPDHKGAQHEQYVFAGSTTSGSAAFAVDVDAALSRASGARRYADRHHDGGQHHR